MKSRAFPKLEEPHAVMMEDLKGIMSFAYHFMLSLQECT
jgi:hypothetical protein